MTPDTAQYIVAAITPIGVMITLTLLWRSRRERARREISSGNLIIEYGAGIKSVPILVAVAWAIIIPIVLHDDPIRRENIVAFLILAVLITVPLVIMTIEAFGVAHRIREDGFEKRSPWSSGWAVKWEDIAEISFSQAMQWFVISSREGRVRLHLYLNGLRDFAETVQKKVPREKWSNAETQLNNLLGESDRHNSHGKDS